MTRKKKRRPNRNGRMVLYGKTDPPVQTVVLVDMPTTEREFHDYYVPDWREYLGPRYWAGALFQTYEEIR